MSILMNYVDISTYCVGAGGISVALVVKVAGAYIGGSGPQSTSLWPAVIDHRLAKMLVRH